MRGLQLKEDPERLRVHVQDGVRFLEAAAAASFDVVREPDAVARGVCLLCCRRACGRQTSTGMARCAPPRARSPPCGSLLAVCCVWHLQVMLDAADADAPNCGDDPHALELPPAPFVTRGFLERVRLSVAPPRVVKSPYL
jgi:hypothetical protein